MFFSRRCFCGVTAVVYGWLFDLKSLFFYVFLALVLFFSLEFVPFLGVFFFYWEGGGVVESAMLCSAVRFVLCFWLTRCAQFTPPSACVLLCIALFCFVLFLFTGIRT